MPLGNHRLLIGGNTDLAGWSAVNLDHNTNPVACRDLTELESLNIDNCDAIYLVHGLQRVTLQDAPQVLLTLYKMLSPLGSLFISVPDLRALGRLLDSEALQVDQKLQVARMIFGANTTPQEINRFGYNQELLEKLLRQAGFVTTRRIRKLNLFIHSSNFNSFLNTSTSLNVVAHKCNP
jgi:predicted SAM-dependent methyltransferase